jgi:hypothetical protein
MDFQFKPLGKTCAGTGRPLVPGSWCHSVLVERQGQQQRLDYAAEAWNGPPTDAIGHWRSRVPLPKNPQALRVDPDALWRYFEQLCEEASPSQDPQRYIAALLLLKLKRLRLDDVIAHDDGSILVLEGVHGEGMFEVPNLALPDAESSNLQQQLKVHLATEWAG